MIAEIKRYTIKVPSNISIYYCDKTQIIIFSSPHKRRALKLKLKLVINQTKKNIQVTQNSFFSVSNHDKKNLKVLQATYVVLIKQLILEVETSFCKRLILLSKTSTFHQKQCICGGGANGQSGLRNFGAAKWLMELSGLWGSKVPLWGSKVP